MALTLEHLRVLVKIVEAGSLTRAAQVLGMQRSNVSRALAQLEATLGVTLLERTTRTQRVTEAGREVHERALGVLAAIDDTVRVTQRIHEAPQGLLRLTCGVEFGMSAVGAWVEEYLAMYPQVKVQTEYATREVDLVHEGFDLAVRVGPLPDSRLVARRLGEFAYGLFASPAYLARAGTPRRPADLDAHDLIVFAGGGDPVHWTLQQAQRRHVVRTAASARLRVNAGAAVLNALRLGLGIGQLPLVMAHDPLRLGAIRQVLPRWRPPTVPVFAVYPSNRYLTPKVRAFVDLAAAQFPGGREAAALLATAPASPGSR